MGENYFGITDTGRIRTNNEDRFIAQTVFNDHYIIACVIDGVGGYVGGEVAAQLTRDEIINGLDELPGNIIDRMVSAIDKANERIIREKEESPQNEKMACVVTLALVDIKMNVFYFAHVGDTRLYLCRDGSLIKVTKDHSTVGFLEDSGRLTEEAAMLHPKRNEVNKVLGYESQIALEKDFIDTGESPFLPGDTILLCSDGLTDMVPSGEILAILNGKDDLREKGKLLINAANAAGGKDNITVALVYNDKSPVQYKVTKPLSAPKKNDHNGDAGSKIITNRTKSDGQGTENANRKKKINRLLLFCIIFFLVVVWLMFKGSIRNTDAGKPAPAAITKQRNLQELNLLDSINAPATRIVKLNGGQPIFITDTILIKNDSLHIMGNGVSFVRDSAYHGPAFMLASSCKYILLDSLSIENFNVGLLVTGKGLHLKNVRFSNCLVPLQFQPRLPQSRSISGKEAETIFYYSDSLIR